MAAIIGLLALFLFPAGLIWALASTRRPLTVRAASLLALSSWLTLLLLCFPLWERRAERSHRMVCQANLKHIALALLIYAEENDNTLFAPSYTCAASYWNTPGTPWWNALQPYVANWNCTVCPSDALTEKLPACAQSGRPDGAGFDAAGALVYFYTVENPRYGKEKWPLEKEFLQAHRLQAPNSYAIKHSYLLALPALSRTRAQVDSLVGQSFDPSKIRICGASRGRLPGAYPSTPPKLTDVKYPAQKVLIYEYAPFHLGRLLTQPSPPGKHPPLLGSAPRNFAFADGHVRYYRAGWNNLDAFGATRNGKTGNGYSRSPNWTLHGPAGKDLPDNM